MLSLFSKKCVSLVPHLLFKIKGAVNRPLGEKVYQLSIVVTPTWSAGREPAGMQSLSSAVPEISSSWNQQFLSPAVPEICSSCHLQLLSSAAPEISSSCHLQFLKSAAPFICSWSTHQRWVSIKFFTLLYSFVSCQWAAPSAVSITCCSCTCNKFNAVGCVKPSSPAPSCN